MPQNDPNPAAPADPRTIVFGPGPVFMRWIPERAAEYPELVAKVAAFDAGEREAAQQAANWLREHSLLQPAESVARLLLDSGHILGFYALANGSAELTVSQRHQLGGSDRRTQPATILTQIAREHRSASGTGAQLLQHAWAVARRAATDIAATVLALDPYDSQTAEMWINRWGFHESAGAAPGGHKHRLWLPLTPR
jgi:hypothetical protein